jgi:hypothetical protein
MNKVHNSILNITYDTYGGLDYLELYISNYNNIDINLVINKGVAIYNTIINQKRGIEFLTKEIINKFIIGLEWILNKIPFEERNKYFENIINVFKNDSNINQALIELELSLPCDILPPMNS